MVKSSALASGVGPWAQFPRERGWVCGGRAAAAAAAAAARRGGGRGGGGERSMVRSSVLASGVGPWAQFPRERGRVFAACLRDRESGLGERTCVGAGQGVAVSLPKVLRCFAPNVGRPEGGCPLRLSWAGSRCCSLRRLPGGGEGESMVKSSGLDHGVVPWARFRRNRGGCVPLAARSRERVRHRVAWRCRAGREFVVGALLPAQLVGGPVERCS